MTATRNRKQTYETRIAATEAEVRTTLRGMSFHRNSEHPEWDAYDRGSTRVCFFSDDERLEVYAFDGHMLDYKVDLSLSMPASLILGIISQILKHAIR